MLIGDDVLEILWRDAGWVEPIDELRPGSSGAELAGQQPRCMSLLWFQRNPLPTDWMAQREVVAAFDA